MQPFVYADALGFVSAQGTRPLADVRLPEHLQVLHTTVAPPIPRPTAEILADVAAFRRDVEMQSHLRIVEAFREIDLRPIQTSIVMGLQCPPIDAEIGDNLAHLYEAGVRITCLTYQGNNRLGGGFDFPDIPFTEDGENFLRKCADVGMILDLSHCGTTTAWSALRFIKEVGLPVKVMISHTGSHNVYPHSRNTERGIIEQIVELDGMVGVYTLTFGLDRADNSATPFLRHLAAIAEIAGSSQNVAIGSDGVYFHRNLEVWEREVDALKRLIDSRSVFNARFPDTPVEFNNYDRMHRIQRRLDQVGFTHLEQANLLGVSFLSFLERSL